MDGGKVEKTAKQKIMNYFEHTMISNNLYRREWVIKT